MHMTKLRMVVYLHGLPSDKVFLEVFVLGDREAALRVENGTAILVGELCRRYCMGMRLLAPKLLLGGDVCHFLSFRYGTTLDSAMEASLTHISSISCYFTRLD
jgi:hypothetical protein